MKKLKRVIPVLLAAALLMALLAGCGTSDGKTHLTFQIWDVYQRPGMEAMCKAYTAKHPDVEIEVQATSWGEYWTKLEAAAESNTMPDIFWMHTNQLLYYADFGMLADVTDLYDDVDPNYYENHFSEISRNNASGSDGRLYGVPKDKDNGMLVYNKEMFDAAGVPIPPTTGPGRIWRTPPKKSTMPPENTASWLTTTTSWATGASPIRRADTSSPPTAPGPVIPTRAQSKESNSM